MPGKSLFQVQNTHIKEFESSKLFILSQLVFYVSLKSVDLMESLFASLFLKSSPKNAVLGISPV